jgi:hypothetical protein
MKPRRQQSSLQMKIQLSALKPLILLGYIIDPALMNINAQSLIRCPSHHHLLTREKKDKHLTAVMNTATNLLYLMCI